MNTRFFLSLLALSLLLSVPSLLRIPRVLPLLNADVRAAVPETIEQLRAQGLWLVNVDLLEVQRERQKICFLWEHRYTSRLRSRQASRKGKHPAEIFTTCIPAFVSRGINSAANVASFPAW